ncbi:MAG: hypothetical protein CMB99_13900 [Flavobacteriaceae bacterium]|nr:hypothetical protein [Flavobacteriaceae bacterium]|tara:strand:+ start:63710 stop:64600 length:891 start_codon:yes stop_codon:yes gene_type:complete
MKTKLITLFLLLFSAFICLGQKLSPYIEVGTVEQPIEVVAKNVKEVLESNNFQVLGSYNVSDKESLKVIAFTKEYLKKALVKVKDRGALGAVMKVGLEFKEGKTIISYTNPEYILRAYLPKEFAVHKALVKEFSGNIKQAFSAFGNEFKSFGGSIKAEKLGKYHYKIMMPYFTDPISLNEFNSFEDGYTIISNNLTSKKGKTEEVYRLVDKDQKVAVFGIGLKNSEEGEPHFLPKIGESHLAALPYEIILQGNEVTMLHGKYRIALHWPDLTMGTFMKIMSTPGDIEDMLKAVCQK